MKTLITERVLLDSFMPYSEYFQELSIEELDFSDFRKDMELENFFNDWLDEWEKKVKYQDEIIRKYRSRWNAEANLAAKFSVRHNPKQ